MDDWSWKDVGRSPGRPRKPLSDDERKERMRERQRIGHARRVAGKKQVTIAIDMKTHAALVARARERGSNLTAIVIRALEKELGL